MKLSDAIDGFLDYLVKEKKFSLHTLKDYKYYLLNFREFSKRDDVDVLTDQELIKRYKLSLKDFQKSTKNYFLISLRSFIKYLNSLGITTIKASVITLDKQSLSQPQVITEEKLKELIRAINTNKLEGLRDRSIIELFFNVGLKVSELTALNIGDLDLKDQILMLSKSRRETMGENLTLLLKLYLAKRQDHFQPLFIRFKGEINPLNNGEKMRLSDRSVERMIEKYVKKIRLPIKITPQILRHSFAAHQLSIGEDLEELQRKLGHKNRANSKIYTTLVTS